MPLPVREEIRNHRHRIEQVVPCTVFNFDFPTKCNLNARNPSDDAVLVHLAVETGLDKEHIASDLNTEGTRPRLTQEMAIDCLASRMTSCGFRRFDPSDCLATVLSDYIGFQGRVVMKKLLIGVAVLLLVVIGAVLYVGSNLDGIIKTAIETYGSKATQTQVSVADVKISLQDGAGSISGLNVGNPEGFADANIFKLGAIRTKIDTASLTKNPIVIDELVISAPQVFYEIDKSGGSNVDALKRNLEASMPASASASHAEAETPAGGEEMKMVIRRLVVESGQANMRIAALGDKQQSVNLLRIELTDIGKKSNGATAMEVAQLLSDAILKNVKGAVLGAGVQQYLGKSVDELKQNLKKGALDKLGSSVGGAGGAAGDQIGGAMKGLLGN